MGLRGVSFRWGFGSLANGVAAPALDTDELALARNIEHRNLGSINKRPGMKEAWRVADTPENSVAPVLSDLGATAGSTLGNGTLYVRLTYSTVAGETDDLYSTQASLSTTSGHGYRCWFPFHIFAQYVAAHAVSDSTLKLSEQFTTDWLGSMAEDTFAGWYLMSRDPSLQDETGLGVNPENWKLWDRLNFIAKIDSYFDGVFTLDRSLAFSLADRPVDILMADRSGLPIRAVNVYVSSNGTDFYFYDSYSPSAGANEGRPGYFDITSIPTANRRAPSTRITRTAPAVAAVDALDTNPQNGIIKRAETGIRGGVYSVRYCWETADQQYLDSGGWPEAVDFGLMRRPRYTPQMTWPSKRAIVGIMDGDGIEITPPTKPQGVDKWHCKMYNGIAEMTELGRLPLCGLRSGCPTPSYRKPQAT